MLHVPALAKLNLALEVLHRRSDGYHELRTVFQTVSLGDSIGVAFSPSSETSVDLDSDIEIADNLAVRAAYAFLQATKTTGHVKLRLEKRIPMGGGLGGGSTDAAAVLYALNKLSGASTTRAELMELASSLGSDVPFFLIGGTAFATGRGTELYPLPSLQEDNVLLVTPRVHSGTSGAYAALGRTTEYQPRHNVCAALIQAMALSDDWTQHTVNDFEGPIFAMQPDLRSTFAHLAESGARTVRMTGSGAAIFAVYESAASLKDAAAKLDQPSRHIHFVGREEYLLR